MYLIIFIICYRKLPISNDHSEDEMKIHNRKQTHLEHDSSNESKKEMKPRKKKRNSSPTEFEEVDSPKKKRIKSEPGSDSDSIKIKKKKKDKDLTNGSIDDSFNYEDEYLNFRVKQEKELHESASLEKSKKNKKRQSSHNASIDDNEIGTVTNVSVQNDKKSNKKKKIKKENSVSIEESFNVQEQSQLSEEESKEVSHKSKKKKKSEVKTLRELSDQVDKDNMDKKETPKQTSKYTKYERSSVENLNGFSSEENRGVNKKLPEAKLSDNLQNDDSDDYGSNNHKPKTSIVKTVTQRTPRLSERIKFEDEIESDSHSDIHTTFQNITEDPHSSHLKSFLEENCTLQTISNYPNKNAGISDDDEIWILKCPHDVNINKLNNTDINLDNKCKIKINGETYCGNLDDNVEINVMSSTKNDFKIKKMVPNGIIHFRKRLPKPHFHEDNVMVNNQTDFIPLPATKCRHPLFGSNYKDAIHVSIKGLNSSQDFNASYSPVKKKKKKHKKNYDQEVELQKLKLEYDSESSLKKTPKEELDQDLKRKKAKKKKHSNDNDYCGKKSKKIKLEPDSAEAWASEKAIEENLFNF